MVIALVFGVMLANWGAAVAQFKVNALFSDQWSFYSPMFEDQGWWALFSWQHGPHRQGIAFVLTSWVMEASHWDARVESLWVAGCLALATALAIWMKQRLAGRIGVADTWIVISGLSLLQYETVLLVPNASHSVFPLMLLLVAAHLMVRPSSMTRLVLLGVVGALALFTGFGLFVAAGIAVYLTVLVIGSAESRRGGVAGLAILVIALLGFAHDYTFSAASDGFQFPPDSWWAVVKFIGLMLSSRVGLESTGGLAVLLGLALAGVFFVIVAAVVRGPRPDESSDARRVAWLMLGVGFLFVIFTVIGRVHLGEGGAIASRYVTLVVLFWWGLDLMLVRSAQPKLKKVVSILGWTMALGPFLFLVQRPAQEWWGSAGMRKGDLVNLRAFEQKKLAWIAEMADQGDWHEAERRVPGGLFPNLANLDPPTVLGWMADHELSFFHGDVATYAWLPWRPDQNVVWARPRSGGKSRNTADGARWLVNVPRDSFVSIPLRPHSDRLLELGWGADRGSLQQSDGISGVSLAGGGGWTLLGLDGVQRAEMPRIAATPDFGVWSFQEREWLPDRRLEITAGFWGWEEEGAFGWASDVLQARVVARKPSYLNVGIDSRFDPVATGEVVVQWGDQRVPVPWQDGRSQFSIPVDSLTAGAVIQLINSAGAKSPAELGMWDDERRLALRLNRFSVDAAPDFPLLDLD